MDSVVRPPVASAAQANRAVGAMFFCLFGGAWLALWAHGVFVSPLVAYGLIGIATAAFFWLVLSIHQGHVPALDTESERHGKRRKSRGFYVVNAGQWLLLVVVANLLAHHGLTAWIIPAAIFIIGAHFLPLAKLFDYPPHYVTGAAMMLVAAVYPLLAPAGASSPVGCLGAGIILWGSAAWALTRRRQRRPA